MKYLGIGADDSNHAGLPKKAGEIIVLTFSANPKDSELVNFPNRRDYARTERWLNKPRTDYRFTVLTAEKYRHMNQNLAEIAPKVILQYIHSLNLIPESLGIFLDGPLKREKRKSMIEVLSQEMVLAEIKIKNFIKKKGRSPVCPPLVYHADVLANLLYSTKSLDELSKEPHFVSLF